MIDDKVGVVPLRDVEHLRAYLDTRRRHREGAQFEALHLLQILEDLQRLVSGRVVVIHVGDLLALEAATGFVLDKLYSRRALRPVSRRDWEQIREPAAVRRSR